MAFWAPILQFVGLAMPAVAPLVAVAATVAAIEKFQRTETQEESKSQDENST